VTEDFIVTSGGNDICSRQEFKRWVKRFQAQVHEFQFHGVESFQNADGSRIASRWQVTGRNNGLMGAEPKGVPFEMTGTAVWEAGEDGRLRHNWVERNAFEVYGIISRKGGKVNVFVGASGFPGAACPNWVIFDRRARSPLTAAYPQIAAVPGGCR
jgi:hypothetical protein